MPEVSDDDKFMASIGHVCLQYANLETQVAVIIWSALGLYGDDPDKGAMLVGSLDLKARVKLAIDLLEEQGAPNAFIRRLKAIQTELRGDKGLMHRRNVVIHGAHKTVGGERVLVMLRAHRSKREVAVGLKEMHTLVSSLNRLANEAFDIIGMVETWHRKKHGRPYAGDDLPIGETVIPKVEFVQRLHARAAHLWRRVAG